MRNDLTDDNKLNDKFLLVNILQKLYCSLLNDELEWSFINDAVLDILKFEDNDHWLCILDKPERYNEYTFNSKSFEESTLIKDECFKIILPGDKSIFLMNVTNDDVECDLDERKTARELWMVTADGEKKYLCSNTGSRAVRSLINCSYELLESQIYSSELEESIKEALSDYISGACEG